MERRIRNPDERQVSGRSTYNLNFIDWDNEYEAVFDHMNSLEGN